jgi:hypothetical protein
VAQDQRVEFLFAAQVSGQEQLQKLISSVDSLRKETEQLKSANTGLASSTDAVIRNGVRYNNAIDAQSKALRQARQGTQQLGMQINDFATSVSTGASPIQAFNQQIGQVGIAMSQMGGIAGTVGGFLAGPWGAAIVIGTMILAPFIEGLFNTGEAAKKVAEETQKLEKHERTLAEAASDLIVARARIDQAMGKNVDSYLVGQREAIRLARIDIESAKESIEAAKLRLEAARANIAANKTMEKMGAGLGAPGISIFGKLREYFQDNEGKIQKENDDLRAIEVSMRKLEVSLTERRADILERANDKTNKNGKRGFGAAAIPASKMEKLNSKFSMLGFYEEFFAQEFEQNDKSLAKVAEDQINSLLNTIPEMAKMSDEMAQIISRNEELNNSFDAIGQSVSNSFKGMLTGAMSFKDAMKGIISAVIDELWKLFVVQQIVGVVKSAMGSVFGVQVPGKAIGGSVGKNRPYMVGEQGPELFIPGGSGTIIPNRNLSSNGGGGNPINISVDARGASDPAAVRAQVQQGILEAAPAIIAAAESRTVAGLRRPRLGGVMQ